MAKPDWMRKRRTPFAPSAATVSNTPMKYGAAFERPGSPILWDDP